MRIIIEEYKYAATDVREVLKVLLEDVDGKELVFGKYTPEEIINLDAYNPLTKQEKDFIYEFAVWIYRAIVVFHNDKRNKTSNMLLPLFKQVQCCS